jgi:hypothetical protein
MEPAENSEIFLKELRDLPRHTLAPYVICLANQTGVRPGQVCGYNFLFAIP